jgi:hypothetical protein
LNRKSHIQITLAPLAQNGNRQNRLVKILSYQLLWILVISFIIRLIYYSALLNTQAVDSASYLTYHANILKGETAALRTPVYPYFIKFIAWFGTQTLIDNVITAQIILSFLSIILFYKIVLSCLNKRAVIFAACLVYGAMLPVINFDKLILTESLSAAFSLIFIYAIVSYLQKPACLKACAISLFVFIAIMLRPSFIYLLPLVITFFLLRWIVCKKEWKMCSSGLIGSAIVILLILGYSNLNEKNAGFNGISVVSNNNEIDVITKAGIYNNGDDPEISAAIESNLQLIKANPGKIVYGINIMKRFNPDRMHKFIITSIMNQPFKYLHYIGLKLYVLRGERLFTNYANFKAGMLGEKISRIQYGLFSVRFFMLYIFIAIDLILIIALWIKRRSIPWFKIFLWLFIVGQLAVAVMGGYVDYQRLILPAIPALTILLFFYIDRLSLAIACASRKRILCG